MTDKFYPLKHWFATLVCGPILLIIFEAISSNASGLAEAYPLFLLFGIAFSLPCLALYWVFFLFLLKMKTPPLTAKTILKVIAIAIIFISSEIIKGSLILKVPLPYSVAIVLTSFFIRFSEKEFDVAA